jgi:hypothetical protein
VASPEPELPVASPEPEPPVAPPEPEPAALDEDVSLVDETEPTPKEITRSFLNTRNKADLVKFGQELGLELDIELKKADMINRIATHIGI